MKHGGTETEMCPLMSNHHTQEDEDKPGVGGVFCPGQKKQQKKLKGNEIHGFYSHNAVKVCLLQGSRREDWCRHCFLADGHIKAANLQFPLFTSSPELPGELRRRFTVRVCWRIDEAAPGLKSLPSDYICCSVLTL